MGAIPIRTTMGINTKSSSSHEDAEDVGGTFMTSVLVFGGESWEDE